MLFINVGILPPSFFRSPDYSLQAGTRSVNVTETFQAVVNYLLLLIR